METALKLKAVIYRFGLTYFISFTYLNFLLYIKPITGKQGVGIPGHTHWENTIGSNRPQQLHPNSGTGHRMKLGYIGSPR